MNLLAFLWLIGCVAAVSIAAIIPTETWQNIGNAIADRIRNPRPSASERILQGMYKNEPKWTHTAWKYTKTADPSPEDDEA